MHNFYLIDRKCGLWGFCFPSNFKGFLMCNDYGEPVFGLVCATSFKLTHVTAYKKSPPWFPICISTCACTNYSCSFPSSRSPLFICFFS